MLNLEFGLRSNIKYSNWKDDKNGKEIWIWMHEITIA
jgi:hypothetical protein